MGPEGLHACLVSESSSPAAVIASRIGSTDPSNPNRVLVDGVKIDVIDTEAASELTVSRVRSARRTATVVGTPIGTPRGRSRQQSPDRAPH